MRHPFIGKGAIPYSLAWITIMVIHASLFFTYYKFSSSIALIDSFVFNALLALIGMSFWFVVKYSSSEGQKTSNSLLSIAGAIVIAVVFSTFLGEWSAKLLSKEPSYHNFLRDTMLWRTIISALFMAFVVLVYYLIRHQFNLKVKEEKEVKLQSLLKQSELDALKFQINPHFIFNSLNSISSLTISAPQQAQEMIIKLSDFLRSSVGRGDDHLHSLEEELKQMHLYLDIEKIRFGDRLILNSSTDNNCLEMSIPNMILQPLYENAIKYAVYEHLGDVSIDTTCSCSSGHLVISISNSYSTDTSIRQGKGIGLNNIRNRMALLYNAPDLLQIEKNAGIFKVTLKIPQTHMIKALIIDDEKLARDIIRTFLSKNHPDIEVVDECSDGFEGLKLIKKHNPAMIFLDIQMPKLTGFEMLELMEETPVIIFSTAYQEYAIKAFELSAADYLLKPYSSSRFDEAVNKAKNRIEDKSSIQGVSESLIAHHQNNEETLQRVVLKNGHKIIIIPIDKIDYISGEDDYVAIHSEGQKYLKQITLKYLEDKLPAEQFVRVHRSFIVAVNQIDRLEAYSKDSYLAMLKNGEKINVSRNGYAALRKALNF